MISLVNQLSYAFLGLSFLVLCTSFWMLRRAHKHLAKVTKMAAPWWFLESKKTRMLPDGYHELANIPVGDARKTRILPIGCYERSS